MNDREFASIRRRQKIRALDLTLYCITKYSYLYFMQCVLIVEYIQVRDQRNMGLYTLQLCSTENLKHQQLNGTIVLCSTKIISISQFPSCTEHAS